MDILRGHFCVYHVPYGCYKDGITLVKHWTQGLAHSSRWINTATAPAAACTLCLCYSLSSPASARNCPSSLACPGRCSGTPLDSWCLDLRVLSPKSDYGQFYSLSYHQAFMLLLKLSSTFRILFPSLLDGIIPINFTKVNSGITFFRKSPRRLHVTHSLLSSWRFLWALQTLSSFFPSLCHGTDLWLFNRYLAPPWTAFSWGPNISAFQVHFKVWCTVIPQVTQGWYYKHPQGSGRAVSLSML